MRFGLICIALMTGLSCSRKESSSTKLTFTMPVASTKAGTLQSVGSDSWGIADPSSYTEFNCFGIFVSGPEPGMSNNTCSNESGQVIFRPGLWTGGYLSGETITLDIPSGSGRTIAVVGLQTSDITKCANLKELNKTYFSHPFILGKGTFDLSPGAEQTVSILASYANNDQTKIKDCEGPAFNSISSSGSFSLTSVSPNTGGFTGGQLLTLHGNGFVAGMSANIGGYPCTGITVVSPIMATCTSTAGSPGSYTVNLLAGGQIASLASGFSYQVLNYSVQKVVAGAAHICSLLSAGRMKCWGSGTSGGLGNESTANLGDNETTADISAVDLGPGAVVLDVSAGNQASCALLSGGVVKCFGNNTYGQLGVGSPTIIGDLPGSMGANLVAVDFSGTGGAVPVSVSVGTTHACSVMNNGTVWCWGQNTSGQLGNSTNTDSITPVLAVGLTNATKVRAGLNYTCALTSSGSMYCWGNNASGQLGDNTLVAKNSPTLVTGLSSVTDFDTFHGSTGTPHTCAIDSGAAYCWGANSSGQLGDGTTTASMLPTLASGLASGVTSISVGGSSFTCAVVGGAVKCWGMNSSGQLGIENTSSSSVPVATVFLSSNVMSVTAGNNFACAVRTDGNTFCWGAGSTGALGNGSTATIGDSAGEMSLLSPVNFGVY